MSIAMPGFRVRSVAGLRTEVFAGLVVALCAADGTVLSTSTFETECPAITE